MADVVNGIEKRITAMQKAAQNMMTDAEAAALFNKLVLQSDLSNLTETELVQYYKAVCNSLGMDALTKPFDVLVLQGKKTLYPNKAATAQLTKMHACHVELRDRTFTNGVCIVTARVTKADGSAVEDYGTVSVENLRGDGLANAIMKAATKAKRRAVLSAFGLGMTDESEIESIAGATTEEIPQHLIAETLPDPAIVAKIVACETAEQLTECAKLIKDKVSLEDKVLYREHMEKAATVLGVVWKGGKYVEGAE